MSRWRVGTKLGRTLYRDEQLVGMVDSASIAAEIVERMNAAESDERGRAERSCSVCRGLPGVICYHCGNGRGEP